jgi:hypothetical protein
MSSKTKFLLVFSVLGISLIFLSSSTFSYYDKMVEADFFNSGKKYEARDVEDLLIDKQSPLGVIPNPFSLFLFLEDNFLGFFSSFSLSTPLLHPTSSVLRC